MICVPRALGFVKDDHPLHSRLVSFLQSFSNEHMDVLNECSDRALAPGFTDATFVITRNRRGNNFYEWPVARKENTGWATFTSQDRIVNDVQPRERFASTGNTSDEANDFL